MEVIDMLDTCSSLMDTLRNNNYAKMWLQRRFDVMITLLLRNVPARVVYPNIYPHGLRFIVICCGLV